MSGRDVRHATHLQSFIPHDRRLSREPRRAGEGADVPDPIPCAGGIVFDSSRRLLLIQRGRPPGAGLWSIPGGRCRPGEPAADACVRELLEETGLRVAVTHDAGRVLREAPGGGRYVIDDFVCRLIGGTLAAGDDADDARWVTRAQLQTVPLVEGLYEALSAWSALPD
jgi:8-oxo-dGTP diphosphatase